MYVIEVRNEEGVSVERIELHNETMTTVQREVEEQLHNLIEGYSLTVTLCSADGTCPKQAFRRLIGEGYTPVERTDGGEHERRCVLRRVHR